jgi:rhomboid protease GluP
MNQPDAPQAVPGPPAPGQRVALRLPLSRPRWTWVFLAANVAVWLLMTLAGGSEDPVVLIQFGANFTPFVAAGEYWRLLTANFIHIGLVHLLFNSYAIYVLGVDVEALYGSPRFVVIYLLTGLAGSIASFALRPDIGLSAGASTAVFGLLGTMIAFFVRHRDRFGGWGRQRLGNTVAIVGINLLFGLTSPRIDMLGHIGGFVGGLVLGWLLCPMYQVDYAPEGPRLVDTNSVRRALPGVALFVIFLIIGVMLGVARWNV